MENQLGYALTACARVMRPVVRLALALGVKHPQLEGMLRDLLLDEAHRSWRIKGVEPNLSQLSVTTGLNRRAVTSHVRAPLDALPRTEQSAAAKTLTLWLQLLDDDAQHQLLPVMAADGEVSFESVARAATRGNVHHRTVLDELARLDMVSERDGRVELLAGGFVPAKDLEGMLAFLGDNARDHLLAAVSNTLKEGPPLLERAVFAQGLSIAECERIHQRVRERWNAMQRMLTQEMTAAVDLTGGAGKARMRVGIYTYFEELPDEATATQSAPVVRTKRAKT